MPYLGISTLVMDQEGVIFKDATPLSGLDMGKIQTLLESELKSLVYQSDCVLGRRDNPCEIVAISWAFYREDGTRETVEVGANSDLTKMKRQRSHAW